MSLVFSNSALKSGIVEKIYRNTGADTVKYPLADVVSDVNSALDRAIMFAIKASGKFQIDDTNHTDYNIIYLDLIQNQRDYSFTTDEGGNLILDIFRVMVADENGVYYDLDTVDQQSKDEENLSMVDGRNQTGKPIKYDKTANGIFFDVLPSYNMRLVQEGTSGIKIFINREGSYFTSSDTTKKPGIDGRLHEYLDIYPTYLYAVRKGLNSAPYWANEVLKFEGDDSKGIKGFIKSIYSQRAKDEQLQFTPETINPF